MPEEIKNKKATEIDLKMVFADILRGYSTMKSHLVEDGKKDLYIKHTNIYDNVETDYTYDQCFKKAKSRSLPTEKEQTQYLIKEDLWTKEQDMEVARLKLYISNLNTTKSKLYLMSQIDQVKQDIEESEAKLTALISEREELMGFTAEKYANKRANEIYIQRAVYADKDFSAPALSKEDFNYISDQDLMKLTQNYNEGTKYVSMDNIKKISLMGFFCNYFYLCDDNPQIFYGKPVIDLTFYQAEIFAFGRYFKNLAQESKAAPPDEIRNDPDKLMEFYEARKNAEEVLDKVSERTGDKGGATSLVGATKEDLEALGYQQGGINTINLSEVASKKGGKLSMEDFIELHE